MEVEVEKQRSAEVLHVPERSLSQRNLQLSSTINTIVKPSQERLHRVKSADNPFYSEYRDQFKHRPDLYFNSSVNDRSLQQAVLQRERLLQQPMQTVTKSVLDQRQAEIMRPTVQQWNEVTKQNVIESTKVRTEAEMMRQDMTRVRLHAKERTKEAKETSDKRIGQRIEAVQYWRGEIRLELERLLVETDAVDVAQRKATLALQHMQEPVKMLENVMYTRDLRKGGDNTYDPVDVSVFKILDTLKDWQQKTKHCAMNLRNQISINRATQHELELDERDKFHALQIDQLCQALNEYSHGVKSYLNVEKVDNHLSTIRSWEEFTEANLRRSRAQREASKQMRDKCDAELTSFVREVERAWRNLQAELETRIAQLEAAKRQLEEELAQLHTEIAASTRAVDSLRRALMDQERPLKLAETRLHERTYRENMEYCRDDAYHSLVREVNEIKAAMRRIQQQLEVAQQRQAILLQKKAHLERDLQHKIHALEVDRERCQTILKTQPIAEGLLAIIE